MRWCVLRLVCGVTVCGDKVVEYVDESNCVVRVAHFDSVVDWFVVLERDDADEFLC